MSERKVLNKYYPPDFDPSKIPKLHLAKNRQYSIRIMAPFNMRCNTCGEYIYKGKKFNSRKETVEDEDYLGLRIFRFYIKCPRCVAEIAFKTDPQRTDYALEAGATRNFEASKKAEEMAVKEAKDIEEEEANNPMKVLENRTKASRNEMEMIENLEELRDLNARHAKVDYSKMLELNKAYEEQLEKLQDEEDDALVKSIFGEKTSTAAVKRLAESDSDQDSDEREHKIVKTTENPTDILTNTEPLQVVTKAETSKRKPVKLPQKSLGSLSKSSLKNLVRKKEPAKSTTAQKTGETSGETKTSNSEAKPVKLKSGLALLGNYSDSDSCQDSS